MNTKKIIIVILGIFLFLFVPKEAKACDIEFEIIDGEKEISEAGDDLILYEAEDVLILKVKVTLTHRTCPVALKKTEFKMNGFKVIGATEWKQTSAMEHERKLKIKVLSNEDGKVVITAIRTCDKDGGFGSLELNAVPKKESKKLIK